MHFHPFDQEYVRKLTEGDPVTENEFAAYFGELLFLKLRSRLRSLEAIEDIKQETLLRVLQTLRQKGGVEQPERFGAFVNSVCNNVVLEFYRRQREHEAMDDSVDPPDRSVDLDAPLVHFQRKKVVEEVLAKLSSKDQELLREVFLEERNRAEVCSRYAISQDNLRVLLHRARSRFRKKYLQRLSM